MKKYFKALVKLINTTHIVTWRNDTLGHGATKFSPDEQMISGIDEKRDSILGFATTQQNVLAHFNSFAIRIEGMNCHLFSSGMETICSFLILWRETDFANTWIL